MAEFTEFNINDYAFVRLTDYGKRIYLDHFIPFRAQFPKVFPESKIRSQLDARCNAEGWTRFHLWELMMYYGDVMYVGNTEQPFEGNAVRMKRWNL